jgi:Ca2+-binding EF-hand superfamily protein
METAARKRGSLCAWSAALADITAAVVQLNRGGVTSTRSRRSPIDNAVAAQFKHNATLFVQSLALDSRAATTNQDLARLTVVLGEIAHNGSTGLPSWETSQLISSVAASVQASYNSADVDVYLESSTTDSSSTAVAVAKAVPFVSTSTLSSTSVTQTSTTGTTTARTVTTGGTSTTAASAVILAADSERVATLAPADFQAPTVSTSVGNSNHENEQLKAWYIATVCMLSVLVLALLQYAYHIRKRNKVAPEHEGLYLIFTKYDADKSGFIDQKECRSLLMDLNPGGSEEQVNSLFARFLAVDADRSSQCSFDEFTKMAHVMLNFAAGSTEDSLKAVFNDYDVDSSGTISAKEMTTLLLVMSSDMNMTENVAAMRVRNADVDGSGEITFPEFVKSVNELLADATVEEASKAESEAETIRIASARQLSRSTSGSNGRPPLPPVRAGPQLGDSPQRRLSFVPAQHEGAGSLVPGSPESPS